MSAEQTQGRDLPSAAPSVLAARLDRAERRLDAMEEAMGRCAAASGASPGEAILWTLALFGGLAAVGVGSLVALARGLAWVLLS